MTELEKGKHNGLCARSACSHSPAEWYNYSTRQHYCTPCARKINSHNRGLCVRVHNVDYASFELRMACAISQRVQRAASVIAQHGPSEARKTELWRAVCALGNDVDRQIIDDLVDKGIKDIVDEQTMRFIQQSVRASEMMPGQSMSILPEQIRELDQNIGERSQVVLPEAIRSPDGVHGPIKFTTRHPHICHVSKKQMSKIIPLAHQVDAVETFEKFHAAFPPPPLSESERKEHAVLALKKLNKFIEGMQRKWVEAYHSHIWSLAHARCLNCGMTISMWDANGDKGELEDWRCKHAK